MYKINLNRFIRLCTPTYNNEINRLEESFYANTSARASWGSKARFLHPPFKPLLGRPPSSDTTVFSDLRAVSGYKCLDINHTCNFNVNIFRSIYLLQDLIF